MGCSVSCLASHLDLQSVLREYKVHYSVWGTLCQQGFSDLNDFAERFDDKAAAKASSPDEFLFQHTAAGWTRPLTLVNSVRVANAWEEARARVQQRREVRRSTTGAVPARVVVDVYERSNLEMAYNNVYGEKPSVQDQLCDSALGKQFKEVQNGRLGYLALKELVPYMEDDTIKVPRI